MAAAWTGVSPLLMTVLLLRVSGVRLLEQDLAERRPAYRDYMDADWAFHHAIFRFASNDYLMATADALPAHLHRLRESVSRGENDSQLAVAEHAAQPVDSRRRDGFRDNRRLELQSRSIGWRRWMSFCLRRVAMLR